MPDTLNINGKARKDHTYDAIVIGSGISGGWAAKELCEKGLKTLVLERGRNVEHVKDYPTANKEVWEFPYRLQTFGQGQRSPADGHFFVKREEHPYVEAKPFSWTRGYQVGGKSLMWARMVQRWSDIDFEANAQDGNGVDWPIRYADLAPWYSHVEKFIGVSGSKENLPQLPDGEFLPAMELNCLEKHIKTRLEASFPGRNLIMSRQANLTQPHNGRGQCMYRNRCSRGCPYGGYFSSNSSTLPAAMATDNLTVRPFSVVHSIIYDETTQKASGVRVIDSETMEAREFYAKIIFVNASTLNTTLILLNSTSSRFPNGLGNDSGVLGHYLMDHNYRGKLSATYDGMKDKYYFGRRPAAGYIPRYRNFGDDRQSDYLRGYAYSIGASRGRGNLTEDDPKIGAIFKEKLTEVGPWTVWMTGMGEHLPHYDNLVKLSADQTDKWGIPQLEISCEYRENEVKMLKAILDDGAEMLEASGMKDIEKTDTEGAPGRGIHEMGTARMGKDPKTSILNGFNQMHAVKNVFVSDGACMTSSACQNPSITYMALTARAVDYAVKELNKQNI
ncbi:MAG: GMC family oxidoreductase [Bacteroidia bacterium]|nr:GMC family oxidoreductase [Bacteroidia bacterium]